MLATYLDCGSHDEPHRQRGHPRVARTAGRGPVAIVAVVAQLVVLYWPVVTVEGPVSWTDKVVHLLVFAVPTYAVGRALRSVRAAVLVFAIHAPVSELVQHCPDARAVGGRVGRRARPRGRCSSGRRRSWSGRGRVRW